MNRRGSSLRGAAAAGVVLLLAAGPAFGAGFSIFEQGSKAMGMAGAFTAQADDGSAMFHNVGGLAFFTKRQFQAGATFITFSEAEFEGFNPFPGASATGEQETLAEFPPHFYWVEPLGSSAWKFGLAVNSPFGLTTEWKDPEQWAGRFIAEKAALRALDLNPNLGVQLSDTFGIGFGAIVRFSDVELRQSQAAINPFTLQPADIARVRLESDFDEGFGWQVGFLHRVNNSFSWGAAYRSKLTIEYGGDARFTQVLTGFPQFDAIVATLIPFNQDVPIETEIEFPDQATIGVAFAVSPRVLIEVDANWTGWSSFDTLVVDFDSPLLPTLVREQNWDDTNHYRVGARFGDPQGAQWRVGYVFDENPIPEATLGPLLPDSDRDGITVGYGRQGSKVGVDLALMYLPFDERDVTTNAQNFNGSYNTTAWLFGGTISW